MRQARPDPFQYNQMFLSGIEKRNYLEFKVIKMNVRAMDIQKTLKMFAFMKLPQNKTAQFELQLVKNVFTLDTIQQYTKMSRVYNFQQSDLFYFRNKLQPITANIGSGTKGKSKEFLWSSNLDEVFNMVHQQGFLMDIQKGSFVSTKNLKQDNSKSMEKNEKKVCELSPPIYIVGSMEVLVASRRQ